MSTENTPSVSTPAPSTPRTPNLAQRYPALFEHTPILTQREMSARKRLIRQPECGFGAICKSTPPARRIMPTPDVRVINFKNTKPVLSPHYNAKKKTDYLNQSFSIYEKPLGRGSFAMVAKAESKDDGKKYAIKLGMKYKTKFDRYQQLREVVFLQFVNHPNCVRFVSAWEEADRLHIQTELCEGNLHEYIEKNGELPEPRVWDVLLDVLRAVVYLHFHHILHLDIKPENILFDSNGIAKLSDFGLAFDLISDDPDDCRIEGDSRYLAREALDDEGERVSTKRDIYSLGVTVLQLATDLYLPPNGDDLQGIRDLQLPDHILNCMSGELFSIVSKMMSEDPVVRPEAQEILSMSGVIEREFVRRHFVEAMLPSTESEDSQRNSDWLRMTLQRIKLECQSQDYYQQRVARSCPSVKTPKRPQYAPS
ncbi:Membrane-associated tyrosine- and threonine-specific cdc2-inhibitory kinase-like protein [Aphelenchoides besseyi]|nr:Membrane-associated tyrosine- and threonine-specific cdc2-inhibitory kinase-like protein [Aphelenchoides besseyi]